MTEAPQTMYYSKFDKYQHDTAIGLWITPFYNGSTMMGYLENVWNWDLTPTGITQ